MSKQNLASLWLAKLLKRGGFKGECEWSWADGEEGEFQLIQTLWMREYKDEECTKIYPAPHILDDLCIKYKEEMFGDGIENKDGMIEGGLFAGVQVYTLLEKGKKEEAEKHLWENCKFNPKNKP